jgi:hypothetical protein
LQLSAGSSAPPGQETSTLARLLLFAEYAIRPLTIARPKHLRLRRSLIENKKGRPGVQTRGGDGAGDGLVAKIALPLTMTDIREPHDE